MEITSYEREIDLEFWLSEIEKQPFFIPVPIALAALKRAIYAESLLKTQAVEVDPYSIIHE